MKNYIIYGLIAYAVSCLFFFGFGYYSSRSDSIQVYKERLSEMEKNYKEVKKKRDELQSLLNDRTLGTAKADTVTQWKYLQGNTIRVTEIGKIEIVKDTIYLTKPFIAKLDTVIVKDTVNVSFSYPNNMFDLRLKLAKDSLPIKYITVTKYETQVIKRPLWLDILSHTGAGLVGYGIGKIK